MVASDMPRGCMTALRSVCFHWRQLGLVSFRRCRPGPARFGKRRLFDSVHRIMTVSQARGTIARSERSALDRAAQPYQDLIDRLFYAMAGLTDDDIQGLEDRLARML